MNSKIIFIVGPTAAGKTRTAIDLASVINGEIISCDSMQIYKGMPVITQSPTAEELARIKHHLVAELSLEEEFSAAEFVRRSTVVIKELIKKGKIPVFAGGTGLYVKALIDGLFPSPAKDNDLRHQLESEASALGTGYLYNILKEKDPDSASLIHANDLRRIIRALEVYYLTGVPISEHKKNTRGIKDDYEIVYAGLSMGRELLYKTIDERVDKMFEDGLVEEVKKVIGSKLSMTAGLALGIREVRGFLEGEYPENTARELLKQNTRRYAKRQLTWFGADKRIRWFDEGKSVIDHCRACL